MWTLVDKPQEYYSNKYPINHSEIGLINQLNANELGHHLVGFDKDNILSTTDGAYGEWLAILF